MTSVATACVTMKNFSVRHARMEQLDRARLD